MENRNIVRNQGKCFDYTKGLESIKLSIGIPLIIFTFILSGLMGSMGGSV